MTETGWLDVLQGYVAANSVGQAAKTLGVSTAMVSQVVNGKYPGRTERIQARVEERLVAGGGVDCPYFGRITGEECTAYLGQAKAIGLRVGNPDKLRQHKTCLECKGKA